MKEEFSEETNRKDKLLSLIEVHEEKLFHEFKAKKALKNGFFSRHFHGVAEVVKVGKSCLHLKKESGRPLGILLVTPEIANLSKQGDHWLCALGSRNGEWHIVTVNMIGSHVGNKKDSQMHLSIGKEAFL